MKRPLRDLLSIDPETLGDDEIQYVEEKPIEKKEEKIEGLCVECGDQVAEIRCLNCIDEFCSVCFGYLHRTGKRKNHKTELTGKGEETATLLETKANDAKLKKEEDSEEFTEESLKKKVSYDSSDILKKVKEQCKFIPMRLTMNERKLLRLVEAALNVSDYTDKVDVTTYKSKSKRIVAQLREMCSILAGLVVATDMDMGKSMFFKKSDDDEEEEDFAANAEWYKSVFEIGRRYKIMNPEKMRDSFGKLMYMIMDSRLPEIKDALEFDFYKPIRTVYSFLEEHGDKALQLLDDPLLLQAVVDIVPEGKSRATIQAEIKRKESAIKVLAKKYSSTVLSSLYGGPSATVDPKKGISAEDVRQCLYSIGDYHSYLRSNRYPVECIIKLLKEYFSAQPSDSDSDDDFSLGISSGKGGARLSHSHTKQFHYVHQSLTLWSEIMRDMFMLWSQSDSDLVSDRTRYELTDTGQGFNRIKPCPSVSRSMHNIIQKAMDRTGQWIGSSVVHLGDRAVPNALFFLDKYTQVPRILNPVYLVIQNIDKMSEDPYIEQFIEKQFGSIEGLKKSKCHTLICSNFILTFFFSYTFRFFQTCV